MLKLTVIVFCLAIYSCTDTTDELNDEGRKKCLKTGGVPILSVWDHGLADCIYKNEETK
jgi:hypothetical protein